MSAVDRWKAEKPLILVGLVEQLVGDIAEAVENLRDPWVEADKESDFDPHAWVVLYRRHRQVQRAAMDFVERLLFAGNDSFLATPDGSLSEQAEAVQAFFGLTAREPEVSRNMMLEKLRRTDTIDGDNSLSKLFLMALEDSDLPELGIVDGRNVTVELRFFVEVWMRCMVLYGEYPVHLMRCARGGDIDAIEKVLRLDKSAIYDRKIGREWNRVGHGKSNARHRLMSKALSADVHVPDEKKLKIRLAGMVWAIMRLYRDRLPPFRECHGVLPQPLSMEDIREYFDAVAQDRGIGLIDPDLPRDPATFERQVRRATKLWRFIPQTGQK